MPLPDDLLHIVAPLEVTASLPDVAVTEADHQRWYGRFRSRGDVVDAVLRVAPLPPDVARVLAGDPDVAVSIAANPFIDPELWCHLYLRMPRGVRFEMARYRWLSDRQRAVVVGRERVASVLSRVVDQLTAEDLAALKARKLPSRAARLVATATPAVPRPDGDFGAVDVSRLANVTHPMFGAPVDAGAIADRPVADVGIDHRRAYLVGEWLTGQLGEDAGAWQVAVTLMAADFDGSWGELAAAARALTGEPTAS